MKSWGLFTMLTEPETNNRFSIISQVLPNSVFNSVNNKKALRTFCYNCIDYSYQDQTGSFR